jgi:hypothetical protein
LPSGSYFRLVISTEEDPIMRAKNVSKHSILSVNVIFAHRYFLNFKLVWIDLESVELSHFSYNWFLIVCIEIDLWLDGKNVEVVMLQLIL